MGNMTNKMKLSVFAALFATATAMAAPKPLTIWIMPNGASPQETLEKRLELFTKKTGIPTKVQVLDWGEAWNRITQALANQRDGAPDVVQLGTTWIPYFASRNEIKPLNEHLSEIQPARFVPVSWNTTHIDSDSIIYSVPWFIDIRPVLANKRILKKYGITRESVRSYDGFRNAIRKVNEANEILEDGAHVRGYAFPGKSDWNIPHNFAPWIWSNGGSFIQKDSAGWHANILSKETLLGIASYLHFVMDSLVMPEALQSNTAQIAQQFNNGELAFIVNTSEIVMQTRIHGNQGGLSNARIGSDSVLVLPIPQGSNGSVSFIGGSNLAIPSSNNRKEALDLLLFLVNDENLDAYTKQIGLLPPSKKVLQEWAKDEDYKTLTIALETGRTYVPIPVWGELEQQFVSMFSTIWEQMEIPSLYSEDKLYEIFKQYTIEIDKKLNYPTASFMTLAEFKENWNKVNTPLEEKTSSSAKDTTTSVADANLKKAPFVFVAMLVLGFLFAFFRKKKK
ncbi:extracellular solute-binding protein [uncultured Fibrobacter sp.]|uniref:extracellular solute-binding protein n=1 Tax=uncultured Fibrobacter sp. TaxID=261512 RepID=UPI0025FB086C|nr:extracellular solute-binding protein [uncultured Fibrobacter sp.]